MTVYDLIIVGGGLVGAGLACALRDADLKMALVDAKPASADDPRLFALSYASCQFLKNIGIWDQLAPHATAINEVHVSYQKRFGTLRLKNTDVQLSALGHVIPAYQIEAAMQATLRSMDNVMLYQPATLTSLQVQNEQTMLNITTKEASQTLASSLVCAADGTHSTMREQLNIAKDVVDYQQDAIVTRIKLTRSHHHLAYERFTKQGVIAMLPLGENESATIWSLDRARARELMSLSDDDFLAALQKNFGYRLGKLQSMTQRFTYPLQMVKAKKFLHEHIFLLGNAAHTLHPIAAQGFNLALFEVASFADAIRKQGKTITTQRLNELVAPMQQRQTLSMNLSHQIACNFADYSFLRSLILPLAFIGTNLVTPIKRNLLQKLLGQYGKATPSLFI